MAKEESIRIRLTDEEKSRWTAAAEAEGMSLSAWLRKVVIERLDPESRVTVTITEPSVIDPINAIIGYEPPTQISPPGRWVCKCGVANVGGSACRKCGIER